MTKSMDRKFDEFFNQINQQIEPIDYLIEHSKQYGNVDGLKEHIFCPECQLAKLTFVHTGKGFHLRTHLNTKHLEGCYYDFDHIDTKSATEFFKSLNKEQVQSKLASMMRYLLSNKNNISVSNKADALQNNPLLIEQKEKTNTQIKTRKSLRRQKLTGYIDESIAGDLYIFYGDVKFSVELYTSKNNFQYYKLIVKTKNKQGEWRYRTSLYRGKTKDDIDVNAIYKIVFIGVANFKENSEKTGKYMNIELIDYDSVLFQSVDNIE
ncbi:hypothetical protein [Moraxella sp.]|uniref:hypothetical protein n=1 Tax=Moraxella sp. TaxID=479 RepID=UPI0026DC475E|nr:hypothetical protein [Moraxella sp.]MDO4895698.1 hypothetical protein [Moraxella sp.]